MSEFAAPAIDLAWTRWRPLAFSRRAQLGLLLGIGAVLRIFALSHQSIWLDEAFSIFVSKRSPAEILSFVATNDNHPPLYYLVLHYWLNLGDSEVAVRSLSAVFGVISIFFTYKLGRALYDEATGMLVALLVALSPFLVWYSQEARMYSLLFLLAVLASYALVSATKKPGRRWWALYAVATAAALYTDNGAIWFFIATNVFCLFYVRKRRYLLRPWFIAQAGVVLLYLPWLPSFISQSQRLTESFWLQPPTFSTVLDSFLSFNSFNFPIEVLGIAYVVVALLWVHLVPKREDPQRDLLSAWLFLPIVISFLLSLRQPIFLLRNLIAASLGFYLLLGHAAWSFGSRKIAFAAVAPLLLMNAVSLYHDYFQERKEEWRDAAAFVDARSRPDEMLIFDADYVEMPFRYYERGALPSRGYPYDESLVHKEPRRLDDLQDATKGFAGVWLVLSHVTEVDQDGIVKAWFDANGSVTEKRQFKDIEVIRYRLNSSQAAAPMIHSGGRE